MMKKHPLLNRPALTAIAAALAFLSTPVIAQDASVQPADAPTVEPQAPSVPLPTVDPIASPTESVQIAPAAPVVQPVPTPSPEAQTVQRTPAERAAPVAAAPARQVVKPATAAPQQAARVTPTTQPAPEAAPALVAVRDTAPVRTLPDAAPTPPAAVEARQPSFAMMLGAGALLLLMGFASLIVLSLRDRREDLSDLKAAGADSLSERSDAPFHTATSTRLAPATDARWSDIVAATATGANAKLRPASTQNAALEALVAERPSEENPFLTRKNRLRRAKFILQHDATAPGIEAPAKEAMPAKEAVKKHTSAKQLVSAIFTPRQATAKRSEAPVRNGTGRLKPSPA